MANEDKAILKILKNPYETYNSRSLSKIIGISHAGMFKLLKKLEKEGVLISKIIGKARIYSINFENSLAIKRAEFALMLEAHQKTKWIEEFKALKFETKSTVLFGSITRNEKEAKDIDLLVIADKNKFKGIRQIISDKNKITIKRIHLILQNEEDFKNDLKNKNKAIIEIIKTGIVLFGQEEFVKILKAK